MEIGINAMSTIGAMRADFPGTVRRLKAGGIDYVEAMSDWGAARERLDFYASLSGGPGGWDPENTLRRLEALRAEGMDIPGMFIFDDFAVLDGQAEALGDYCQEAGIRYVVLSFLDYGDLDAIYEKIAGIRRLARVLGPKGVRILQHNHENDLAFLRDRDGREKRIIDIFTEQLRPEELMLEIDVGWVLYAGGDPAAYVKERLDRLAVLHFKDIRPDFRSVGREEIFVPCGQGAVDFQGVLDAIPPEKKAALRYVIDQDASEGDIVEDLCAAAAWLRSLRW